MKKAIKIWATILLFVVGGCGFVADARNAIATSSTFLKAEQDQYLSSCQAQPTQNVCVKINQGIALNNTLIDALNVYCSGVPANGAAGWNQGGPCVPVKTAQSAVVSATANLSQVMADLKSFAKVTPPPASTPKALNEYRKSDLDAARVIPAFAFGR